MLQVSFTGDKSIGASARGLRECLTNQQDGATGRQCCGDGWVLVGTKGQCPGFCFRKPGLAAGLSFRETYWLFKRAAAG